MEYTQQVVYDLPLPYFLVGFKKTCIEFILNTIQPILQYLKSAQVNHSYTFLVILIVLFIIFKLIIQSLMQPKQSPPSSNLTTQDIIQVRQLQMEIKKMKKIVKKLMEHSNNLTEANQELSVDGRQNNIQATKKLISCYKQAIKENENISMFILDSHNELLTQMKKIKRLKINTEKTLTNGNYSDPISDSQKVQQTIDNSKELQISKEPIETSPSVEHENKIPKLNGKIPPPVKGTGRRNVPPPPIKRS